MKIAFVVPRYGVEVVGGAEFGVRMVAERLAARPGWSADVFTTRAQSADTWADHYPEGDEKINGVVVHRHDSVSGRSSEFLAYSDYVFSNLGRLSDAEQMKWIDLQGPVCPEVLDAAEASDADIVVFKPYLFWPTVHGIERLGARAVMYCAAHDEAPIRLPLFHDVFTKTPGFIFNMHSERRIVQSLFPIASTPHAVLGLGVEVPETDPAPVLAELGVDEPYVLCLGRVDDGKGAGLLASWFAAYKDRHPSSLRLVFAGPVSQQPPSHSDITLLGAVDDNAKAGLLRGARALISPSFFESLSLVVLEGWMAGLPVLVNGACQATVEHVERSRGGLIFNGFSDFEIALTAVVTEGPLRSTLVANGREYVERWYEWDGLLERYCRFFQKMSQRRLEATPFP